MSEFEELLGKTLELVICDGEAITFDCSDGTHYQMYHNHACCEDVFIEDVVGDFEDLIGLPILLAEEVHNNDLPPTKVDGEDFTAQNVCEWTFYKLATNKGRVTIRWFGTSNGSYSTTASFEKY